MTVRKTIKQMTTWIAVLALGALAGCASIGGAASAETAAAEALRARLAAPDAKPVVLITGSSRGIGLELARQYAERGWNVVATCRTPANATALADLDASYENLDMFELDVTDYAEMDAAYREAMPMPFPAREAVAVLALPKGARVEISMIAQKG